MSDVLPEPESAELAILRRRAERLAQRAVPVGEREAELELLAFRLGSERFALPLAQIRGVVALTGCTRVPGAPAELLGVIHVRGELLPLASLRRLLGLAPDEGPPPQALLCVERRVPALGVDHVDEVIRVPRAELRAAEGAGTSTGTSVGTSIGSSGYIEGLLADGTALLRADLLLGRLLGTNT